MAADLWGGGMPNQGPGDRKHRAASERFRHGFLAQAAEQLQELSLLLDEEPDACESVAFELRRLSDIAGSLQLPSVARAALDAAGELEAGKIATKALRRVANAIRHTGGTLLFGPIAIVGAGDLSAQLRSDAELCCEPIQLFEDLSSFAVQLHTEQPAAVVLPIEALDAIRQLRLRERFPVLAHGQASAWERWLAAIDAGAQGSLVHPFRLADVTRLARWLDPQQEHAHEVLLFFEEGGERDALIEALEELSIEVTATTDPPELIRALEIGAPRAVILGARLAGSACLPLTRLIRSHPRVNHVPILVAGRPEDPAILRELGVDDVMRSHAAPEAVARRAWDRMRRTESLPWKQDPSHRLANRLGILDELDEQLAKISRTGEVLSVVLIEIVGLRHRIKASGASTQRLVRRLLARLLRSGLRRTDRYGELGLGILLVSMPGAEQQTALHRMESIAEAFREGCSQQAQLQGLQLLIGVADTRRGLVGVAQRAEQDLRMGGAGNTAT